MQIREGVKATRTYPEWVEDRDPFNSELRWNDYSKCLEGSFLVSSRGEIFIDRYVRYPRVKDVSRGKATSRQWYEGYWYRCDNPKLVDAWMLLPTFSGK